MLPYEIEQVLQRNNGQIKSAVFGMLESLEGVLSTKQQKFVEKLPAIFVWKWGIQRMYHLESFNFTPWTACERVILTRRGSTVRSYKYSITSRSFKGWGYVGRQGERGEITT